MIIKVPSDALAKVTDAIKHDSTVKEFSLQTWYRYMFPYIPYRTGALASTVKFESDGIHFAVPYAQRIYFGTDFNFSKEVHPLAQAHWAETAMDIHGKAIADEILAFILTR